ncbi:MAG: hypothetical protein KDD44_01485, partial [Bdellovibrionales bacterium]|nr:hypothetical protein [Bdellovibrionales bacterium]
MSDAAQKIKSSAAASRSGAAPARAKSSKVSSKRAKKQPPLSREQINQLIVDHQVDGQKMAWKLLNRWRLRLPKEDVVSIVGIALCEAGNRFDPSYQATFRTFFFYHLRGVLIKEVTRMIQDRNTYALRSLPGEVEGELAPNY